MTLFSEIYNVYFQILKRILQDRNGFSAEELREQIISLIRRYTADRLCLFTSHDAQEAGRVASHILQFDGPPLHLLSET